MPVLWPIPLACDDSPQLRAQSKVNEQVTFFDQDLVKETKASDIRFEICQRPLFLFPLERCSILA